MAYCYFFAFIGFFCKLYGKGGIAFYFTWHVPWKDEDDTHQNRDTDRLIAAVVSLASWISLAVNMPESATLNIVVCEVNNEISDVPIYMLISWLAFLRSFVPSSLPPSKFHHAMPLVISSKSTLKSIWWLRFPVFW